MIERKAVKDALRSAGMSVRAVDALLRGGWAAVVGPEAAETDVLRDRISQLESMLDDLVSRQIRA